MTERERDGLRAVLTFWLLGVNAAIYVTFIVRCHQI